MKKRILSLALSLVMLFSLTTPSAWAAPGDGTQPTNSAVNGYYDDNGNWTQGGTGSVEKTIGDSTVTLSKTATPVAGELNTYDVTLSLVTSTTVVPVTDAAATVLVIDLSNSMNNSVSGSTSRLAAAKAAAKQFLEGSDGQVGYAGTDASADRYLAIVGYGTSSKTFMGWANVAGGPGKNSYDQAIATIDSMAPGFSNSANTSYAAYSDSGGTNLEAGIRLAENLLDTSDVDDFANKFSVVLTDGVPTFRLSDDADETSTTALGVKVERGYSWGGVYYYNTSDEAGDGSSGSNANNTAARNAATDLKATPAKLYTVCFGVANQNTYNGGPKVGAFLEESIASPAEAVSGGTTKKYAFNADNTAELMAAFGAITDSITNGLDGNGWTATDPMPEYISVSGVSAGNVTSANGEDYTWTLSDPETSTSGGTTTYTYTATYRIVIDHTQVEEGVYYPANEPTYLNVEGEQYAFPVPGVTAVYPEYTVTYQYTGEVPAGAPAVPAEATYKYKDTVTVAAAPTLEGYNFSGWSRNGTFEMPNNDVTITGSWAIRDDLTYTVNYYWNGTSTKVADSKEVSGQTFMDEVTEYPINVAGCTPVSDASKTITIAVSGNKIDFYYYKNVEIVAKSDTKVYDGTEHSVEGFTGAPDEAEFDITVGATGIEADTYPAEFAADVVGTVDKTAKYIIKNATDGELTITPLDGVVVTITGNRAEVDYSGKKQSVTDYTVTSIKLNGEVTTLYTVEDFVFKGVAANKTAEGTNVGTYAMGLKSEHFENKNSDFANVTFVVNDGQLKINPVDLTITADSNKKTYDGTALTDAGWEDTAPVGLKGYDAVISVVVAGSQTVVGSSANVASAAVIKNANGDDVTGNYNIKYVDGTLEVTKKAVTVTADDANKVYDGTALTKDSYTSTDLATGDSFDSVTVTGSQTVVGTSDNVPSAAVIKNAAGEDVTASYEITYANGTLEVTKRPITVQITGNTDSKEYNGATQSVTGYGVTIVDTLYTEDKIQFTGDAVAEGIVVGTYPMNLTESLFSNADDNFDVTFQVTDGWLKITPVAAEVIVTITGHTASKAYDGTEHTVTGYDVTISNPLFTEKDILFSGDASVSGIYVGTYPMGLAVEQFSHENPNFAKVTFNVTDGWLEITPITAEIVITAGSDDKMYDGTPLTNDGYTYNAALLIAGDTIDAVVEGTITNVGTVANKVTSHKIYRTVADTREVVDVTACYSNVVYVDGELEITPRAITMTSGSDSKKYDGTPLTATQVTETGDGFIEGEGAAYSDFASITNVGTIDNTFKYTLNEGTLAENYVITQVPGTLTINKHTDAQLVAEGYTGVYDGLDHDGVTAKDVIDDVEGDVWTYSYSTDGETYTAEMPQYKDVGTYTVYVKAENPNYEGDKLITTVPVEITPATIVVTADDHTIATGDPDPELTYQVVTPVEIETPAFSGELVREPGTAKGEYPINQGTLALADGEGFKASNYILEYVPGTLTILQRALTVDKTVDKEKVRVGDTVTYTITVTNSGEVDLETVAVVDQMLGIEEVIGALAVGESWTKSYTYTTTEADEDKTIVNVAVAGAEGETFGSDDATTEVLPPIPDTGDHTPVTMLSVTMLLSAAGIILMLRKQRKEENA